MAGSLSPRSGIQGVAPLISHFTGGTHTGGNMNVDSTLPPSIRHGSVSMARGSRYAEEPLPQWRGRALSRDRQMGFSQPPRYVRTVPAGREEGLDFLQALENVTDRLDTIERNHRMLAQTVATEIESSRNVRSVVTEVKRDIEAYKSFVTGCFSPCRASCRGTEGCISNDAELTRHSCPIEFQHPQREIWTT